MSSGRRNLKNFEEFEYGLSDKERAQFSRAIESGAVVKVNQLGASHWAYLLKSNDQLLECEITYNQKSIKTYSCACGSKSSKVPCKHVQLLCYWHLSKIYKRDKLLPNVSLKSISGLSGLDQDKSLYIIQFLAKTNPASKFWISFLLQIQELDFSYKENYQKTIDWALQTINALNANKINKEKNILLLFQEVYNKSLMEYKDSNIDFAVPVLLFSIISLHKISEESHLINHTRITALLQKYYIALEEIILQIKAPQAVRKYTALLKNEMDNTHYFFHNSESNLCSILIKFNTAKSNINFIIEVLLNKISTLNSDRHIFPILDFLLKFEKSRQKEILFKLSSHSIISSYQLVCYLNSRNDILNSDHLLALYESIFRDLSAELKQDVAKRVKKVMLDNKTDCSNEFLALLYKASGDIFYLKTMNLVPRSGKSTYQYYEQFLLSTTAQQNVDFKIKADICVAIDDQELLLDHLCTSVLFHQIQEYEKFLNESFKHKLIPHYIDICQRIQNEFVGQTAKKQLKEIGEHILENYGSISFKEFLMSIRLSPDKIQLSK